LIIIGIIIAVIIIGLVVGLSRKKTRQKPIIQQCELLCLVLIIHNSLPRLTAGAARIVFLLL
jgi:hypothetical protein